MLNFVSTRSSNVTSPPAEATDVGSGGASDSGSVLTVLTDCAPEHHSFTESVYRQHLCTWVLGNVVLYADVTTTTMTILDRSVLHVAME